MKTDTILNNKVNLLSLFFTNKYVIVDLKEYQADFFSWNVLVFFLFFFFKK